MLNFVKFKQMIFKWQPSSYWPNTGIGDIEKLSFFILLASAWDPKRRFDQSDKRLVNRAVDALLSVHLRFFVSSWAIYLRLSYPT